MFIRVSVIFLAAIILSGCVEQQTKIDGLGFNFGSATANESVLLANIIRASRHRHPNFTRASGLSSTKTDKAQLSATFNVLPNAGDTHSVNPTLSSQQANAVAFVEFGASEAAEVLYAQLEGQFLRGLQDRNWTFPLPNVLLIEGMRIDLRLFNALRKDVKRKGCRKPASAPEKAACIYMDDVFEFCGKPDANGGYFYNNPRKECEYRQFIAANLLTAMGGIRIITRKKGELILNFDRNPQLDRLRKKIDRELAKEKRTALEYVFRSPVDIINFLGGVAAPQLYGDNLWTPTVPAVLLPGAPEVPLLRVMRADELDGRAAYEVRIFGEHYVVPEPDYLDEHKDYSVRTMAFVQALQNLSLKKSKIQAPNVISVQ